MSCRSACRTPNGLRGGKLAFLHPDGDAVGQNIVRVLFRVVAGESACHAAMQQSVTQGYESTTDASTEEAYTAIVH